MSTRNMAGDRIVRSGGVIRQEVPRRTPEQMATDNEANCPACGSPMELDLKRRLKARTDQWAPITRRWKCACGMTLTTRGRRENIEP